MTRGANQTSSDGSQARRWWIALTVVGIVLFAIFLRSYWNVSVAKVGGEFALSGNDPYYHKHAVDFIQEQWSTLLEDPLLNYPYGSVNPNPPLYQWSIAVTGAAAGALTGNVDTATWWVTEWSPVIWGALTAIPIFFIGKRLWGTKAGIISAFFLATATSHIERSALGFADHDAPTLFFIVLSFLFYLRAIQSVDRTREWVGDWTSLGSINRGLTAYWQEHKETVGWGALAGLAIAATALIWKGFPYAVGIIFLYAVVSMLADHWSNKDSTGTFLATTVALLIGVVVPIPFYEIAGLMGFIRPAFFIVLAQLVVGLVLVPTRDLPFVLVFPAFVTAGAVGVLMAFFVVPEVARSLLYSLVYFRQSTLYTTIAEAQPADFSTAVFSVGPLVYLLGVTGLGILGWRTFRTEARDELFMFIWALVALFMAHSAVRFMFNATPALALLGGWVTALIVDALQLQDVPAAFRNARGNILASTRRALRWWQVVGIALVAFLVIVPNVFLAVDAGMPFGVEQDLQRQWLEDELRDMGVGDDQIQGQGVNALYNLYIQERLDEEGLEDTPENRQDVQEGFAFFVQKRFGAFGQGFIPEYWWEGLSWLRGYDSHIEDPADRPAFLSWWDYGHWNIYVAEHPSVADNFQNGFEFAGNFITSENETHAIQLLNARYMGLFAEDEFKTMLRDVGVPESEVDTTYDQLQAYEYAPALSKGQAVELVGDVEAATCDLDTTNQRCKHIRYFAVDVRLMPFDDPSTQRIEQSSIFYAPVTLADKDPDDFIEVLYEGTLANPFEGPRQGTAEYSESELTRMQQRASGPNSQFQVTGQKLSYKQAFFNTMFYRTYVGAVPQAILQGQPTVEGDALNRPLTFPSPGTGLEHFRVVFANDQLRMLQFYQGAELTGTVVDASGEPMPGVTVTVYDDAGEELLDLVGPRFQQFVSAQDLNVAHDSTTTDANGTYEITSPFGMDGPVTLVVREGRTELARVPVDVTREEAETGAVVDDPALDIRIEPGDVTGTVYVDRDGDGSFNASIDAVQEGIVVEIGNSTATSDASGSYTLTDVPAGRQLITVDDTTYRVANADRVVAVESAGTVHHNVSLVLREVTTTGNATYDADGDGTADDPVPQGTQVTFTAAPGSTARNATATVDANGTYSVNLKPGDYTVTGSFTSGQGTAYALDEAASVPVGVESFRLDLAFQAS